MFRHIQEDLVHGYYKVFIETEETPDIVPIIVEESPLQLGYDKLKSKKKKSTRCLKKTIRPLQVPTSKAFNVKSLKRKAKTKSQKPKVKKVGADYLSEEELNDLTKDYASEEEVEIKEEDIDNIDEEVARWTRDELLRIFENNEFEDLTKDSCFDNVDVEEGYHSNHTSQDGDDVPTMDDIEDRKGLTDNRDFVMGSLNLYEKEDHEDKEHVLPLQTQKSMLTIRMEWPNIYMSVGHLCGIWQLLIGSHLDKRRIKVRGLDMCVKRDKVVLVSGKNGKFKFNRNTNVIWVSKEIENLIRDARTTKPMEISDIMYKRFRVRVLYYTAWNARNMVMKKIVGSYDKSIEGFTKGCRSILGLDGCFLKGKYGGQCLSIISLDANNGIFPIAVFICRSECQATWMKFLSLMQGQLTLHPSKLTFISDRQKGLVKAVSQVFPHSNHKLYFRHMHKNFKQLHRGTYLMTLAWNASKTYKKSVMNKNLDKLEVGEPDAKTWLKRESYESWCRSYFDASTKYEHVTNNFS
ncbi:hypothetical protein GIB67_030490 [Kingdonia uniflora]|uniref:MULE transposase domain-containing protein n=1 Tax=Kingdonia uniflora TaxID=39325 RepID=A0A7J7P7M7_9MAGN|nr:hypothetical protein GIB67_030490 [Kingdonia uniflora]